MKNKTIQTLLFLNSRLAPKFNSNNVHQAINRLPSSNQIDIKKSAEQYATAQLQSSYGIVIPSPSTIQEKRSIDQFIQRYNELKRNKSLRLAGFIERIAQKMNFEELEEARELLQTLDTKEVNEMRFTLDTLLKVVDQKLSIQEQLSQNHTIASARSLIQQLKKTRKIHQL